MDYHILREIADSWVLLAMFAFFVGVVAWVFLRPGGTKDYEEAAEIPFRHENKPADDAEVTRQALKEARK